MLKHEVRRARDTCLKTLTNILDRAQPRLKTTNEDNNKMEPTNPKRTPTLKTWYDTLTATKAPKGHIPSTCDRPRTNSRPTPRPRSRATGAVEPKGAGDPAGESVPVGALRNEVACYERARGRRMNREERRWFSESLAIVGGGTPVGMWHNCWEKGDERSIGI